MAPGNGSSGGQAASCERAPTTLTLGGAGLLADGLAELVREPQLHADEGLSPLLCQLAPGLRPGQHVAHAALGQAQHLEMGGAGRVGRQAPGPSLGLPSLPL